MKKAVKVIDIFLRVSLALILFWGLFLSEQAKILRDLIIHAANKGYFLPLFWCYVCIVITVLIMTKKVWVSKSNKQIFFILFLAAFVLRLIMIAFNFYVSIDDFKNYLEYGQNLYYGNFGKVSSVIQNYQMPKMGGLAVFNWILAVLFSPTLTGFQIANCVITSVTGGVIFLIGKDYHKNIAIAASLLWAIYPSNILSSQITTNHHASTMFAYLSVLLYLYALKHIQKKRGYFFAILTGVAITVSNFIHPSVIIFILAILFWSICLMMRSYGGKNSIKIVVYILIILCSYSLMSKAGVQLLYNSHVIESKDEITVLFKVVVGLDQETRGKLSNAYKDIRNIPIEEQVSECLMRIKEETKDKKAVLKLMRDKTEHTWFAGDTYIGWYLKGIIAECTANGNEVKKEQLQALLDMLIRLDTIFVAVVYLMGFFALIFWKNEEKNSSIFTLLIWILMGWISIHFFIEVQTRYRYPAMPAFMLLAASGIWFAHSKVRILLSSAQLIIKRKICKLQQEEEIE